jgi:hypothetical protein
MPKHWMMVQSLFVLRELKIYGDRHIERISNPSGLSMKLPFTSQKAWPDSWKTKIGEPYPH